MMYEQGSENKQQGKIKRTNLGGGKSMNQQTAMFSNEKLKAMIIPLFLEQLLVMLVGIADTLVVSYAGEAAVSGVSLVNQFNTIFIYLFTALASGGAVVISQYIGRKANDDAGKSSSQLLSFSTIFSMLIAVLILIGNERILLLMFGKVDDSVMQACITYLRISAYSYPALAVYNSGAALFRSIGKTSVTMYLSVASNVINVIGNLIGVFVLHAGVAGVAYPSLIARTFSAVVITVLCFRQKNEVFYRFKWIFQWNRGFMKQILKIAIPNGMENGIFQLVKVALSSIVALFGTYQIAANGVAQSIWSLAALAGVAMGPVFITVIGQCMGNGDTKAAEEYFKKLTKITVQISSAWNLLIFLLTPLFLRLYALEPETKRLVILLVLIHNLFNAAAFPFSGALSNGLRAAGDVRFTMYVSVISTIVVRLMLSWFLGIVLQMGVIGIAIAMVCDWVIRAVIFLWRERSGKWKTFQVI
jgi:putative MATE family efflux protein